MKQTKLRRELVKRYGERGVDGCQDSQATLQFEVASELGQYDGFKHRMEDHNVILSHTPSLQKNVGKML